MAPKLEQVFTLRATLGQENAISLGSVKGGAHRTVLPITGGFIKGPNIEAEVLPGGGDWTMLDPETGIAHLDVRFQARTKAGDMIYAHYPGVLKPDPYIQTFLTFSAAEGTSKSSDHYFVATPIFEVSSEGLKWMEQQVFVAHGHGHVENGAHSVEYEVYKVVSA